MSNIDSTASENRDVYARVTAQIVTAIENGIGSWRMPWDTSGAFAFSPVNVTSKKPCRGINIVCLWAALCQPLDRVTPPATHLEYAAEPLEQYAACASRTKGRSTQWKSSDLR